MRSAQSDVEFRERVRSWALRVRVAPRQIRIQRMSRKWASCSTLGWLTFGEDLLNMPPAFQDYVIVHELLHLKIKNHGRVFRSLLSAFVPGWERHRAACLPARPEHVSPKSPALEMRSP
jgi:predicted metal-dependent hydrolase